LHFFGIPADDSLGFPGNAVAHCLAPITRRSADLKPRKVDCKFRLHEAHDR
jgi:hypothetical protein